MKISIAICTWNRSSLLNETLESLVKMKVDSTIDWELLIVNNGSTDDTKQVIDSFEQRLPIKYVFQPVPGHSISRNTSVENATGNYIIWTDNDVSVPPDWLNCYVAGFQRHPDAAFFGGKISPVFEQEKPDWLTATWEKCKGVFATRDLGYEERPLGDGDFPYGANFAVRTDVQREFLYDTSHGRNGAGMVGDEEIAVLKAISEAGHSGVWLPDVGIKHHIPADRATLEYVGRYFVGQGQTNIVRGKVQKTAISAWFEAMKFQMKWRLKRRFAPADEWVSHMIRSSLAWGEYRALRATRRGSKSK